MALALKLHLFSNIKLKKNIKDIEKIIVGIDIREDAINYLKKAYKDEKNFFFS